MGFVIGFATLTLLLLWRSVFKVEEGDVAVLTSFGAMQKETYGPGLHRKRPWQVVHRVSQKERALALGDDVRGHQALAADATLLRFDATLRVVVAKEHLERFLFWVERPESHLQGLAGCLLRNEIANIRPEGVHADRRKLAAAHDGGAYNLVRAGREVMAQRLSQVANDLLQEKLGYRFLGIDLTELLPPEELSDALNAVMRVELEAEADYARAESDARQRELSARRSVQIASKKADAVAAEIRTLAGYLERLAEREVLRDYVARRRTEVLAESKTLFVRGAS